MTPYPTEKMIMNEQFGRYNAGYSDGYDKGYTIGREQGINIGKQEILDRIKNLVLKYDDPVDFAYEINFLLCVEHNKEVNNDQIHNNCNTDI